MAEGAMNPRELIRQVADTDSSHALYQAVAVLGFAGATTDIVDVSRRQLANLSRGIDVLCIGSGLAGLVTGYELSKLGISVEIHEARGKIGGRCETIRAGDVVDEIGSQQICEFSAESHLYFNAGPSRIPSFHANILHYCEELGVALEEFISTCHHSFAEDQDQSSSTRIKVTEAAHSHLLSLAALAADKAQSQITLADQDDILSLAQVLGDLSASLAIDGPALFAALHQENTPPKLLPVIALQEIAKMTWQDLRRLFAYENSYGKGKKLQAVGGMDKIAEALATPLAGRISTSSVLTKVETLPSGKAAAYFQQGDSLVRKEADAVIFTMQPSVLGGVANDFSQAVRAAWEQVHVFTSCKVGFEADQFWQREGIFGGGASTAEEISHIWYPSHGFDEAKGVLIGAYNLGLDPRNDFHARSPAERIEAALAQGSKIHPDYRHHVTTGISRSWPLTPHIGGGFAAIRAPEVLLRRHGPYIFAGDYTTYLPGWQEGAVLSALRALGLLGAREANSA